MKTADLMLIGWSVSDLADYLAEEICQGREVDGVTIFSIINDKSDDDQQFAHDINQMLAHVVSKNPITFPVSADIEKAIDEKAQEMADKYFNKGGEL